MIILDASVLIAFLDPDDAQHRAAITLLEPYLDRPWRLSPLTLAEVMVSPVREGRAGDAAAALNDLGVKEWPLALGAALRLAELRAASRLPLPDCCVLLAAETAAAPVASLDQRLVRRAGELGLEVIPRALDQPAR